jgi:hypothetical protein
MMPQLAGFLLKKYNESEKNSNAKLYFGGKLSLVSAGPVTPFAGFFSRMLRLCRALNPARRYTKGATAW